MTWSGIKPKQHFQSKDTGEVCRLLERIQANGSYGTVLSVIVTFVISVSHHLLSVVLHKSTLDHQRRMAASTGQTKSFACQGYHGHCVYNMYNS